VGSGHSEEELKGRLMPLLDGSGKCDPQVMQANERMQSDRHLAALQGGRKLTLKLRSVANKDHFRILIPSIIVLILMVQ